MIDSPGVDRDGIYMQVVMASAQVMCSLVCKVPAGRNKGEVCLPFRVDGGKLTFVYPRFSGDSFRRA